MSHPFQYFYLVIKASLFSTSGLGNVASLHTDLTANGMATDQQFAEALAVGQVSPGPSGLWAISLGYMLGGLPGALITLVGISLPPMLILLVVRLLRNADQHAVMQAFIHGLGLAVVGVFVVVLVNVLRGIGINAHSLAITFAAIVLGLSKRVPVVVVVALGGLAGYLFR